MNKVEMHKKICEELNDLYERKNADYGESFAELRKEYPESICIRLTDKLNRLKKLTSADYEQNVKDESVEDTLKDIANYAIMELVERSVEDRDSYLKKVEDTLNKKLNDKGFVSLNDVCESLGYKVYHVDHGDEIGWVKAKNSDDASTQYEDDLISFYDEISHHYFHGSIKQMIAEAKNLYDMLILDDRAKHYSVKGKNGGKQRKEYKSILIAFYNYDLNEHIQNLQLVYNNGIEEQCKYHSYNVSSLFLKDQVFEIAKYIYTFLEDVYSDDHGRLIFISDMLLRNAFWMTLDVVDHINQEIEYNMEDPEKYDRITEF